MSARRREAKQAEHLRLDGGGDDDPSGSQQYDDHDQLRMPLMASALSTNHQHPSSSTPARHHSHDDTLGNNDMEQQAMMDSQNNYNSSIRRRILDRDADFYQSRGRWRVQHLSQEAARHRISLSATATVNNNANHDHPRQRGPAARITLLTKRLWNNWFYSLAYQRTAILMMILFLSYTSIVFLFALIYLGASKLGQKQQTNPDGTKTLLPFCDMDIHLFMEALYFSLSTMTTIGYGVSDYYFGGCYTPLILVLCQVCCAITFDAVAIGLIFQRISRGHKRGKTIVFSNQAVVQRIAGTLHLMFRVGELRHHQLRDASVRAYCVRHERHVAAAANPQGSRIETTHYVTQSIKLLHEQVSSDVLMSLPQVIVHCMDSKSPISLPRVWYDANGVRHDEEGRQAQSATEHGNSNGNGINGAQQQQKSPAEEQYTRHRERTQHFLRDREAEIVVLVEGTDELTGAIIQARHSYTTTDLAWDHAFVPCVFPNPQNGRNDDDDGERNQSSRSILLDTEASFDEDDAEQQSSCCGRSRTKPVCYVDFGAFHDTVPTVPNIESSPYVFY